MANDTCNQVKYQRSRSLSSSSSTSSSSASTITETRRSVGSWRSSISDLLELKSAKLLWNNKSSSHIWDVDFLRDGSVIFIAGKYAKPDAQVVTIYAKEIRCLNLEGKIIQVPFPGKFVDPGGISVCRSTGYVAVTDKSVSEPRGTVTVLKHTDKQWSHHKLSTNNTAFRLGLTDKDVPVCAIRWEKLVKYTAGKRIWSKSISSSNDLVPYVAIDEKGSRIVVSTPANDRVSVFGNKGNLAAVFPSWCIKKPAGVCIDTTGRVYVADKSNQTISQFSIQGHFLQRIIKMHVEPRCISILEDKYLAVGTHFDGLFLYELEYE